jgi:ABC-type antimicrobial peptide transport system permease subunit
MRYLTIIRFLWEDFLYDKGRSLLTILNLSAILISFLLLGALSIGLGKAGAEKTSENEIVILEKEALDPMQSRMDLETISALSAALPKDQVARVFPFVFHHLSVNDYLVQVRGVPLEEFIQTYKLKLNEGRMPQAADEVVISEGAVHYASWNIGDILTIYGSDFRVSGIVQMPESTFATVWMTLETAEKTFQTEGRYQGAVAVVPAGVNPEDIQFTIETLPALRDRYAAFMLDDFFQRFSRILEDARIVSEALTWISLFMITLGVYHTIHLNLEERGREMVLLHAAGFSIRDLQKILLARAITMTAASFLLALGLASSIIGRFNDITPIVLHGETIPVALTAEMLVGGLFMTLAFCALGVWVPTRRMTTSAVTNLYSG